MWLFRVEGREELKVWPWALAQKGQDVMGTDPRPRRLSCSSRSCPERSLQRNLPKDAGWGNSDPQHIPEPGPAARLDGSAAQTCGDRESPDPGMLRGVLALPSFPAQLQGQILPCCSPALGAVL